MIVINVLFSILIVINGILYKLIYFNLNWRKKLSNPIQLIYENWMLISMFIFIGVGTGYLVQTEQISLFISFEYLILIYTVWIISEIDIKLRIIPNILIIFLIVVRFVFLLFGLLIFSEVSNFIFLSPFIGLLIGGGVLLITKIISRNGIGFGDVKLFAAIGFFVGENGIFQVFFFTFLFAAITGIIFLSIKKISKNDTLPLAPFSLGGLLVYFVSTFLNGV